MAGTFHRLLASRVPDRNISASWNNQGEIQLILKRMMTAEAMMMIQTQRPKPKEHFALAMCSLFSNVPSLFVYVPVTFCRIHSTCDPLDYLRTSRGANDDNDADDDEEDDTL